MTTDKIKLRRSLLQQRQSLSPQEWHQKSDRLCTHLQSSSLFTNAKTILAYFSFRQEPDLSPLFSSSSNSEPKCSVEKHKIVSPSPPASPAPHAPPAHLHPKSQIPIPIQKWGFPRCVGKHLVWHSWQPGDSLQPGAYGITEPHPDAPIVSPEAVDLILVPAVACDRRGYRLGYGGGYYDRLLDAPEWSSKSTIGIVFEFADVPQVPIEPWDKPLGAVCTEAGLRTIEN